MLSNVRMLKCVAILAMLACANCAPPSTIVKLEIRGASDMNNGAPAKVKVYYLNNETTFQSSDFFAVFDTPKETLGSDLVAVDEFQMVPTRTITRTKMLQDPASVIGVIGAFRDVDGAFSETKPLNPNATNRIRVSLSGSTVSIH